MSPRHAADVPLNYIDALARKNSEALSYIPRPHLQLYAAAGQILIAHENEEPCGFLIHGAGSHWCKIYQACIQYDARRRDQGLALVKRLITKASSEGFEAVSLWCAEDLEANDFWKAAGFVYAGSRTGGARRGRKHNRWIFWLEPLLWAAEIAIHA